MQAATTPIQARMDSLKSVIIEPRLNVGVVINFSAAHLQEAVANRRCAGNSAMPPWRGYRHGHKSEGPRSGTHRWDCNKKRSGLQGRSVGEQNRPVPLQWRQLDRPVTSSTATFCTTIGKRSLFRSIGFRDHVAAPAQSNSWLAINYPLALVVGEQAGLWCQLRFRLRYGYRLSDAARGQQD